MAEESKKDFWAGLLDWLRQRAVSEGDLRENELDQLLVMDRPEDVVASIRRHVVY